MSIATKKIDIRDKPLQSGDYEKIRLRVEELTKKKCSYWHVYRWYKKMYKTPAKNEDELIQALTELHKKRKKIKRKAHKLAQTA